MAGQQMTKGQKTQIQIIEVATELFLSKGLYNITFALIAKKIGLTQAAIYKHFEDMDDLVLQACRHWVNESLEYIDNTSLSLEKATVQIQNYLERHLVYAEKNRAHDALLFSLYYYSMRSPKMLQTYREIKTAATQRIRRILDFGNIDGSWKISNTERLSETIHSLVVGEVIKLLIEPHEETRDEKILRVSSDLFKLLT